MIYLLPSYKLENIKQYSHYINQATITQKMRSISIVYKLRDKKLQDQVLNPIKRSVDHYYRQLLEREKNRDQYNIQKQDKMQQMRVKTSKRRKREDQQQIYATLNVMPISVLPAPESARREKTPLQHSRNFSLQKKVQSQKVLRGLKRPQAIFPNNIEQDTSKGSHCKLKRMWSKSTESSQKDTIIVISANFITNQHNFWEEEHIEEGCIKYWRDLQAHANIVWICQKQSTTKKLIKFSKIFNLRLDSIYLILPHKYPHNPTVSFNLIQSQYETTSLRMSNSMKTEQDKKMIIFSGLNIEGIDAVDFKSFPHAVPIITNRKTVVHFIRIDTADKNRFGFVIKVLSAPQLPSPFDINKILLSYKNAKDDSKYTECKCNITFSQKQSNSQKIQQLKLKLTQHFTQSFSVNINQKIQIQDSSVSLQYLIGDMLKRNFRILVQSQKYSTSYKEHCHMKECHLKKKQINLFENTIRRRIFNNNYTNFTYLWEF